LLASLLYLALRRLLQLIGLCFRSEEFKELEIVVLRHSLRSFAARCDVRCFGPPIGLSWPLPVGSSRGRAGALSS
jgi:hypothetical protein